MTALTICIPTIPERRSLLSRALHSIPLGNVEVLIADGPRPMGDKLNEMFAAAQGDYVMALDDDDYLSANFWQVPMETVRSVDFIGYDILWLEDGKYAGRVSHQFDGDTSWSTLDRGVSPKCPVRTEIARRVRFGNEYTADRKWSAEVQEQCETGHYMHSALYIYDHWNEHMVGTSPDDPRYRRPQRDVGEWPYDPEAFTWLA